VFYIRKTTIMLLYSTVKHFTLIRKYAWYKLSSISSCRSSSQISRTQYSLYL